MHSRLGGRSEEGTGYSMQVFSSVSSMGPDGQIKNEQYYENSLGHHSGGNTVLLNLFRSLKDNKLTKIIWEDKELLNKEGLMIKVEKLLNKKEETKLFKQITFITLIKEELDNLIIDGIK